MKMLTYFHSTSLKKINIIDILASYFTDLPLYTVVYQKLRVGDNRGSVSMSKSPHIFDQLGAEHAC